MSDHLSTRYDAERVRADFPIFRQMLPKGLPVTYLDTAASAQKPQCVIDRERDVYEQFYANAYRGVYRFGAMVDEALEESRAEIARFLGAESPEEIVFTSGTTMSLNLVAHGWGRKFVRAGDEILVNLMEHHANLVPWQMLAQAVGATLRYLPLTSAGELDLTQLDQFLTPRTKVVAVTGMSNVLGTINPVRELTARAHAVGAKIVVDGAQSVPHEATRVAEDDIDFLAFSGHKLYGPSGVGVLYGKREILEAMDPFLGGGHMIETVEMDRSTWSAPPAKFEAGTLPIAQAIALQTAVGYVEKVGLNAARAHEQELVRQAIALLSKIDGWRYLGPDLDKRGPILSFVVEGVHPEDLAQLLDLKGVYVRHGHHCTMPLHKWLGIPASIRASFGIYSTTEDVIRLAEAVEAACRKLRQ